MNVAKISQLEKKILKAVGECGQEMVTLHEIAQKAGCSPVKVCEKLKNPEFKTMFREVLEAGIAAEAPEILRSFTELAKNGSYQHGKLLLELSGIYSEKQKIEMSGTVDIGDSPFKNDDEKQAFIENTLKQVKNLGQKDG